MLLDEAYLREQQYAQEQAQRQADLADARTRELEFWNVPEEWAPLVVGEDQEALSFAAQKVAQMADDSREGAVT